jgi:hypothetical protein
MRLNNCVARLRDCVFEMAQSSRSARQMVQNAFLKQFAGLHSSDSPRELVPHFNEIYGEMKDKLTPFVPGNYHASLGNLPTKEAARLVKEICSLYHEVLQHQLHHQH